MDFHAPAIGGGAYLEDRRIEMKLAITGGTPQFETQLERRFGRCAYFLLVNTEDMGFDIYENENAALG